MAKARTRDSLQALSKLTRLIDGRPRIVPEPPLVVPLADLIPAQADQARLEAEITGLIAGYRRTLETDRRYLLEQFEFADMARKVVGVGSVGTRCWIVLVLGLDHSDPLFLQVKEAEQSGPGGLRRDKPIRQPRPAGSRRAAAHAGRQRHLPRLAAQPGRPRRTPHDYYIRHLRDWKRAADIAAMAPAAMRAYGELCGWKLARAHARSGDRIAIASYLGRSDVFDQAIAEFAAAYADQNERDYHPLAAAAGSGRVTAQRDL